LKRSRRLKAIKFSQKNENGAVIQSLGDYQWPHHQGWCVTHCT